MKIGLPKEIKNNENRVALPPAAVYELVQEGHDVFVETGAGEGSTFSDEAYRSVGAKIVSVKDAWRADMVMKVKEPLPEEYPFLHEGLILFTYFHIAANKSLADALLSAKVAVGLGAQVTILDVSIPRLQVLDRQFAGQIQTLYSNRLNIETALKTTDLAIGAVLLPGQKAPCLVTAEMGKSMPKQSVIVDIAIDQGGIFETEDKVTTHDDPTYIREDVIHYAVANMPGAVPQTATVALSIATLPFARELASDPDKALRNNPALAKGVITYDGYFTLKEAAQDLSVQYTDITEFI